MKSLEKYDLMILLTSVGLTCFGLVMVYSSSSVMAATNYHDSFHFLKRQAVYALMGFTSMTVLMKSDYQKLKKYSGWILLAGLILLVLVFIPGIGGSAKGASRWIKFPGFSVQPSEFAKLCLIIFMAYSLEKNQEKLRNFAKGFFPYMVILAMMILILLFQHDLGAALTLFLIAVSMLFLAGTRVQYILSAILLALPFLYLVVMKAAYRKRRITAFLHPWEDRADTGFQIVQSWIGFGNGGIFGQGLGEGKQKLFYLPEAHTDFILSVVGEEIGLIGVLVVIVFFALLVHRALKIALYAEDTFGRHLAFGIAILLGLEAVVNIAVVTGLAPTKGLALPFISYGGSSLVVSLTAVGILLSVSGRTRGMA